MPIRYGASDGEWSLFCKELDLSSEILPVVSNPKAVISPHSSLVSLGKVPSKYDHEGFVCGFAGWAEKQSSPQEVAAWRTNEDYGICLQSRKINAFDIDVSDKNKVEEIIDFVDNFLGFKLPVRRRDNSPRALMAFSCAGETGRERFPIAEEIVEFLRAGQQFIAAGTHPSGARYEWAWRDGIGFPKLSSAIASALWTSLAAKFSTGQTQSMKPKDKPEGKPDISDPVAEFLKKSKNFLSDDGNHVAIICPFEEFHSEKNRGTSTVYMRAVEGDPESGRFRCLHAHCAGRTNEQFERALGYEPDLFAAVEGAKTGVGEGFGIEGVADKPSMPKFVLRPVCEIVARGPISWHLKGVLPKADLGVVYGASGSGKSFFILDMLFALAQGIPWRGINSAPTKIVYVCAEGLNGMSNRISAYMKEHNLKNGDLDNFKVIQERPNMLSGDWQELGKTLRTFSTEICVLDTLAQVTPGSNENSSEGMGKFIAHTAAMREVSGAMNLASHHTGKDVSKGGRGWSGLLGALDVEIEIRRDMEYRQARVSKLKDGRDDAVFGFKLKTIQLGYDKDFDEITSCVLEECEAQDTGEKSLNAKTSALGGLKGKIISEINAAGSVGLGREGLIKKMLSLGFGGEGFPSRRRWVISKSLNFLVSEGFVFSDELGMFHAADGNSDF